MADARLSNKKVAIIAILASGLFSVALVGSLAVASAQEETHAGMPDISGSVNLKEHTRDFINENVKVSFADAATTAQTQVEGGKILGGHLGVMQGYLVYTFLVTDTIGETSYKVVVDAGNGEVLYKGEGHEMGPKAFGHRGLGSGGFSHGNHFSDWWHMNRR